MHDLVTTQNEAKKLEVESARLLTLEHNAREANRSNGQFLAHMSHELRTPIAGIIGTVNCLRDTKMGPEQHDFADCIKVAAGNFLSIVNDILDFSKIESGRVQVEEIPFSVASLVDEHILVWKHIAQQKGLNFHVDSNFSADDEALGDPNKIGKFCQISFLTPSNLQVLAPSISRQASSARKIRRHFECKSRTLESASNQESWQTYSHHSNRVIHRLQDFLVEQVWV